MVRSLLLLCSLALALPAQAQRRSVMEGLQAGNSAIFVSTPTASVYVRTAGTMTVSGNAFSVGTSTFVVAGGSATVAYSMTAKSFVLSGGGSLGGVAQSSITYNLSGTTTETTNFKVCYGSATITTGGASPIVVFYSGDITNSGAAGTYCIINFLQDGAFISPASSTVGMGKSNNAAAGGSGNATTFRVLPAPTAGEHSWCVSLISPFGTSCTFSQGGTYGNQFGVIEL